MREKLLNLMKSEQLSPSRLAELLGIQPSGISHLLSGRNKPSFDLVQKILRRFPHINPDWLLLDSDQMYRDEHQSLENGVASTSELPHNGITENGNVMALNSAISANGNSSQNMSPTQSLGLPSLVAQLATSNKSVKRVIVLFDDHTFESFELPK